VLSGPQVRQSSAWQTIRLGLGIITASSKRVHDGWCSLAGRRGFCVPSSQEGRDTSSINASLLRSFFFLLVVIPANRHSASKLCQPEHADLTSCLWTEANRRGKSTAQWRAEEWPVAQRML
jgi:hypothetical protein